MTPFKEAMVKALELEKKGDWNSAHKIVQQLESREAFKIHAYLHRKEGDLANARYWYNRAGIPLPGIDLNEEWRTLYYSLMPENHSFKSPL